MCREVKQFSQATQPRAWLGESDPASAASGSRLLSTVPQQGMFVVFRALLKMGCAHGNSVESECRCFNVTVYMVSKT